VKEKMKYVIWTMALLLMLDAGCFPEKKTEPAASASKESTAAPLTSEGPIPPAKMDIGDVESQVTLQGTLAKESLGASVAAQEEKSKKNTMTMCTVTVQPPAPPQLFIAFSLKLPLALQKEPGVVVVRGQIMRDNQPIQPFSTIFGGNAAPVNPIMEIKADALKDIQMPVQTMLLYAQANLILLPEGTDTATIDPAQVPNAPNHTATIMSNPVRINFAAPGGTS
jgi:hypothetical protein